MRDEALERGKAVSELHCFVCNLPPSVCKHCGLGVSQVVEDPGRAEVQAICQFSPPDFRGSSFSLTCSMCFYLTPVLVPVALCRQD